MTLSPSSLALPPVPVHTTLKSGCAHCSAAAAASRPHSRQDRMTGSSLLFQGIVYTSLYDLVHNALLWHAIHGHIKRTHSLARGDLFSLVLVKDPKTQALRKFPFSFFLCIRSTNLNVARVSAVQPAVTGARNRPTKKNPRVSHFRPTWTPSHAYGRSVRDPSIISAPCTSLMYT
jgi:hypothetical protein